jgi:hypothetical protein
MGFTREEKQDFQEEAWKLRLQGKSMRALGEALGLSGGYVCQLLQKALEEKKEELAGTAEKHIANQAARLDAMLEALWEKVEAGDPKAIAAALAFTIVTYHYLVRSTIIGRWLSGRRRPRRAKTVG